MKTCTVVLFLIVLMPFGRTLAQQHAPTPPTQAAKPQKTVVLKYPEQKPILDRIGELIHRVDLARAHGKITNQKAIDLENQINAVRTKMSVYKKEDHKTIHSDHMTQDQISTLMSMLDEASKLIPK